MELYIINLSKTRPQDVQKSDKYTAIEAIKDGFFSSTKGVGVSNVLTQAVGVTERLT